MAAGCPAPTQAVWQSANSFLNGPCSRYLALFQKQIAQHRNGANPHFASPVEIRDRAFQKTARKNRISKTPARSGKLDRQSKSLRMIWPEPVFIRAQCRHHAGNLLA
jgi:hypothetical protein